MDGWNLTKTFQINLIIQEKQLTNVTIMQRDQGNVAMQYGPA